MPTINMLAAKSSLSRLVRVLEEGSETEIIIARNGRPAARLVPVQPTSKGHRIGVAKGLFTMPADTQPRTASSLAGLLKRPGQRALSVEEMSGESAAEAPLYRILRMLDAAGLWYRLDKTRADAVLISVTAVGERCEIVVCSDGTIETSSFLGDEGVDLGMEPVMAFLNRHKGV